ncbi:putative glycerol transport protein [Clostridiaceae bacterium JG1575]|nr:putative glycerol transport protein [Clostridiaceae bacterium JG1575]
MMEEENGRPSMGRGKGGDGALERKEKLQVGATLFIGLGFFASSLLWSIYNSFVPLILQDFIKSTTAVGLIMTIDNVFGVIFQPLFGAISDRTRTPIGKRMPYIILGAPICGILFVFIPRMGHLWSLMLLIITFNLIMSIWRSPMIALMPDLTPDPLRSKANGIINLMGGIASIVAFLVGGKIAHAYGRGATFLMGAAVMILAVGVLFLRVREPALGPWRIELLEGEQSMAGGRFGLESFQKLPKNERKSLLFLLLAIFFWFCAYNAVETFFTSYATNRLGMSDGQAAMLLAFFSVSFVLFAVPSGFLAQRIGRRKTIILGLLGLVLVFLPILFIENLLAIRILLLLGGLFWALININSLPMVLELAGPSELGTFTGYYYFFSFSASIASPILFGLIRDLSGTFGSLFLYAPIAFALALGCFIQVTHGLGNPQSESIAPPK